MIKEAYNKGVQEAFDRFKLAAGPGMLGGLMNSAKGFGSNLVGMGEGALGIGKNLLGGNPLARGMAQQHFMSNFKPALPGLALGAGAAYLGSMHGRSQEQERQRRLMQMQMPQGM